MQFGSFNYESVTVELMHNYIKENGYEIYITSNLYHYEIY